MASDSIVEFIHVHMTAPLGFTALSEETVVTVVAKVQKMVRKIEAIGLLDLYCRLSEKKMGIISHRDKILDIVTNSAMRRWRKGHAPASDLGLPVRSMCSTLDPLSVEGMFWLATLLANLKRERELVLRPNMWCQKGFWGNRIPILNQAHVGQLHVCTQGTVLLGFYTARDTTVGGASQRRIDYIQSFTKRGSGTGRMMVEDARLGGFSVAAHRPLPESLGFWMKMQVRMEY